MGFVVVQDPQTAKPYTIKIAGDTPTEDEQRQIQGFIEQQRQVVDTPVETPDDKQGTAIGRGASLGVDVLQQMYGSVVEGIGEETGIKALEDYGKSVVEANEQQIAEKQKDFTRREDIGKDGSYVGDALSFYGETLGQQLPQFAPIIAGGIIGQAVIPVPVVGALIGSLAANLPFFWGSHRERDKEADIKYGRPVEVDNLTSFLYAIPAALLDTVVDRFLLAIPKGLGLNKGLLSPSVGGLFSRAAKGAGAGATVEIPTELGQQVIERYQAGLPIDDEEAMKEYVDVAIASGLVGGTVRATTSAVTGDTKENIEKKEAALAKLQLDIDNQNDSKEASQLQTNLEKNIKEGFGEETPLAIGLDEETVLTKGLDPTQDRLSQQSEGIINIDDLNQGARNALIEERFKRNLNPTNPVTDLKEIKALLEPRFPKITNRLIEEINTVKVPKRYDENQYNTVVKAFKENDVDLTEVNRDTILDKVKKVLEKNNETDQGGVVTTTTAQNIVDQMVLDGHISQARNTEANQTPVFVVNEKSIADRRTEEIQRDRKALETQKVDLNKAKEEKQLIEEDIGKLNQEKNQVIEETKPLLSDLQVRSQARPSNINNLEIMRIQSDLRSKNKRIKSIDEKIAKKDLDLGDKQIEVNSRGNQFKSLTDNIRRLNAENNAINPTLPRSVKSATSFRSQQQNANNSLITAEQASQVRQIDLKAQYKAKRDSVVESLQKYLKKLGLKDVKLVAENVVGSQGKDLSKKDFIIEGEFTDRDGRRIIALSMELYDPNLSDAEYEARLKAVLNHEIIHAVKSLGLFTDAEYKSLVKAAMSRKYVVKDGKKLIERKYTYFDRAKSLYPDLKEDALQEEAVAEMFRDAMDGKLKLAGRPKTLMERFINFFKAIFNAHEENGFQSVDDIFEDIKSGTIGRKERSADREYLNTKESPQAEQGKQSRRMLTTTLNPATAKEEIRANKVGGRVTVPDIQKYMQDYHMKTYGRRLDFSNPEDRAIAINTAVPEILDMLQRDVSGKGWYDEDVVKTFEMLSQIPDLESMKSNEDHRVLWSAIAGVTSNGNSVPLNAKVSTSQLLRLFRTGKLDTVQPVAGSTVEGVVNAGFGSRGPTVAKGLDLLNKLLDKFGERGFSEFWLSQHTLRELGEIRKEAGLGGAPGSLSGGMNSMHLGAKIIGDKTGNFSLAINGYDVSTKDVWFTRMIRRLEGTFDTKGRHLEGKEKGKEFGQPKGAVDRQNMDDFMAELQGDPRMAKFNLSKRDLQAILWYKEQNLYTELGVPSRPKSFSEGIQELNDLLPEGQRFQRSDDAENQAQQRDTRLEGFRERTARQEPLSGEDRETAKRSVRKLTSGVSDNTLYHDDLSTSELITGWVIEPRTSDRQSPRSSVSRQEVYTRLSNDEEFQKASIDALREKGFTDTVPVFRIIFGAEETLDVQGEQLISATLDPEKFLQNVDFLTDGKFRMGDVSKALKYNIPIEKVAGYLPAYSSNIKRTVNKKVKEKGFGQTNIPGFVTVTNPAETSKKLLNLQDEIIADVSDLQPEVLRENLLSTSGAMVKRIVEGSVKTGEDYRNQRQYVRVESLVSDKNPFGIRAEPIEEQQEINRINNFFGTNQEALPTTTTGTAKRSVRKLHSFIRENPEGFTITSDKLEPVSGGFPVAPLKDAEIIVKGDITRSVLREYVQNAKDLATALDREVFLGGWLDTETNQYYLDNVVLPDNREEALYIAEIADQEAFYDLNTFEEVRTEDGIKQLKQDGAYRSDISERLRRDLEQARKRFKEARLQRDRRSKQSRRVTTGEVSNTLFDVAPQQDLDKLSDAVNRLEDQVVTPDVKYSVRSTKPADPNRMREIPINFANVPMDYRRQLNETALRYAYGYVRESRGEVLPITYMDGDHAVLDDGREGGYGAWHIITRGHDKEIRDATGQEPEKIIYTMLRKMVQQEYGNGGYQGIDVQTDVGSSIRLVWENNRPKGYPPIVLSLMFQPKSRGYTVRTVYPTEAPKRSVRRLSAVPTGSQSLFGAEGTFGELDQRIQATTYTNSLQAIEKVIRGGTLGFVSQQRAKKLATSFISKFQDKMIPVAIMLDELKQKGLKLRDAFDPYLQDELFYGITGKEINKRQEGIYNTIVQGIKILTVSDGDIDNLIAISKRDNPTRSSFLDEQIRAGKDKKVAFIESYLYAKHAKERNDYILEMTSKGTNVTPNEIGSGMTNQEADAIINWFDSYADRDSVFAINNQVREVIADTNAVREEGQLSGIFDMDDARWDSYVPLKGSLDPDDETNELSNRPISVNKQIRGREDRRVTGRSKYATDIIGNVFQQNTTSVLRAERNKVGLSMLNLLETTDPDIVTTTEADFARTDFANVIEVTPRKKFADARTGVISQRPQTPQEIAQDPNVLIVKRRNPDDPKEIQEVAIEFKDPRIASAMRGDSLVSPSHGMSGIRFLARVNRFLASVNTSYNPAFIVPNFSRDLITASINIAQYDLPNVQRDMLKNVPSSMKGIRRYLFNNDRVERDSEGNLTDVGYYIEFLNAGGQNVLNTVTTLADQVRDINNIMGNVAKRPIRDSFVGKGAKKLGSLLENTNLVAENSMRVATYKTLRQKGFSPARAAQAARNVTVNFAKTGEYGRILNSMYLFYNASIQGTFAALQAATKSRKVRGMWAGLIAYGLMQDQLAALFGEEDEDGNLIYDKIPDYTLEHNLILPDLAGVTDRSFITIPFPYGFNMAFNTGRSLSRWSRGGYTAGEAANSMEGTLYEIINPLGGTESFLNFVSPTIADPFISVAQNYDYAGRPIYKEPSQFGVGKPDSQLYWNSTTNVAKGISSTLNELTGGTKGVSGVVDVNPALIDFWFEYTIGGLGRFVNNVGDLAVGAVTGDPKGLLVEGFTEENVRRLPVARKFVYSVSEREDVGEYVKKRDRVLMAMQELKRTAKQGDRDGYKATQERFKDELKIAGLVRGYDNARNRLMRLRKQVEENDRLPKADKERRIERYNEMIQDIVGKSNMAMRDIEVSFLEDLLN